MEPKFVIFMSILAFAYSSNDFTRENDLIKIINGTNALPGEFPMVVSLKIYESHICGGVIISPTTILCAAHCLDGFDSETMKITAGAENQAIFEESQQIRYVQDYVMHPQWDRPSINYDVGIIRLKEPLVYNDRVQPVKLSPNNVKYEASGPCQTAGWGIQKDEDIYATDILGKVDLKIFPRKKCEVIYQQINTLTSGMICASNPYKSGFCSGDSGGPLLCKNPAGENFCCGLVSWSVLNECGNPLYPNVFTNVAYFTPWILKYVPDVQFLAV